MPAVPGMIRRGRRLLYTLVYYHDGQSTEVEVEPLHHAVTRQSNVLNHVYSYEAYSRVACSVVADSGHHI